MKHIRKLKYLSLLIIIAVWVSPVFAAVAHLNCSCCNLTKSCCESASESTVQLDKKTTAACSQCKCSIGEKSLPGENLILTCFSVKKTDNINSHKIYTNTAPVLLETGLVFSNHIIHVKSLPLFIKNSAFLL